MIDQFLLALWKKILEWFFDKFKTTNSTTNPENHSINIHKNQSSDSIVINGNANAVNKNGNVDIKDINYSPIVQTIGNNNSVIVTMPSVENKNKSLEIYYTAKENLEYNSPGIYPFRFEGIEKLLICKGEFSLSDEEVNLFREYVRYAAKCNSKISITCNPTGVYNQKNSLMNILDRHILEIENDKKR